MTCPTVQELSFLVCDTPHLVEQAQRLRYEVFCVEKGWIDPGVCPEGVERDGTDEHAVHFLAVDGEGTAVGTVRCLLGDRMNLPAEKYLPLQTLGLDRDGLVEVSRLATLKTSRSQELQVFLGLTRRMWQWGTQEGYAYWLAVSDAPLHHLMVRMGIPAVIEAPPVEYLGSVCIPAAFDMVGTGEALFRRG